MIVAGVVLGGLLVVGMLAAIAMPAFLNQRDLANEQELASALREAALAVEEAAFQAGRYDAVPDLEAEVALLLETWTDGRVVLDADSSQTFTTATDVGLCAEHGELPGSVTYVASEGMHDYVEEPCP